MHAVVGTTGFSDDDLANFRRSFSASNCLIAANFAIGAVLMMKFAEQAAPYFDTAEIIELHHNAKADAPSGTAVVTAQRMAASSNSWAADPTTHEVYPGARGGEGPAGIRIHSVRMVGMTADSDHPTRQLRPRQLHAGCGARLQEDRRHAGADSRPRRNSLTGSNCPSIRR
jgi:4-hydroxy-tetrahydrodipicolinate reductase